MTAQPASPTSAATAMAATVGLGWRRLLRDRLALVFTLAAPVAVATVLAAIYASEAVGSYEIGIVRGGHGPVAEELVHNLSTNPVVTLVEHKDRESLDRALRRREVDAGLVVDPTGGGDPRTIHLVGPPGVEAPGGVRSVVEVSVATTSATLHLAQVLDPDDPQGEGLERARDALQVTTPDPEPRSTGEGRRIAVGYAVVATLVLFVFLNTAAGSGSWVELRELGILARLSSTSSSRIWAVMGHGLGMASYALVQAGLVLVVGRVLLDLPVGSAAGVSVMVIAIALAAGGTAVLVASYLPSSTSGNTLAGPAFFALAMLGGCLWPLEIVPPWLATVGRATPHLWAVEGLRETAVHGSGPGVVTTSVVVLSAFGATAGLLGARRSTHRVQV